ncbi:undecaprenyldiphospho-muramoylpentapeptide beta-N-acetylglucosaminyltransferase [Kineobactrum salinum]|uniref:UDP-N-acetylglucosamine--N-acetylmuramyl-(pentapeptide) pyrophosphoryl-undecaprenol N-acetylglucosamine transferase n=1 Tax=Kineobactrum salinum TaxID=2708301 RepID=A0A6C0U3E9_9GAMM|nr:undecaprenyldiphospho-muramoylpentapeptide beta-N-acetylglucosaminyltransferase [Kineobactrum salinum]QIB66611.1 undecaprenyldiphospho-muramoylpentapeptide beta-N-acetylglucosaminyltransferase [Kineobactrum salinum]
MSRAPLILMLAGGTGGHVYPALAVAEELRARGFRVEWVGTRRGLEARVVPAAGITLHTLPVRGVRGKNPLHRLLGLWLLLWSSLLALSLVLRRQPACVIGMGGYVAGPAGLAAWLLRRPLLIHEQNAVAGTTNRLLAPLARRVLCGFPAAFKDDRQVAVVGNPVRRELLDTAAQRLWDYHGQRPLRLLVLGGSLGAQPLNELLPDALRKLRKRPEAVSVDVWHQAGAAHLETLLREYGPMLDQGVQVSAFIDDMAQAYGWADLVICRAGALTVSELAIMGRPALLVPLPHAIDDHQTWNARALADRGGALLLRQGELQAQNLAAMLAGYIANPQRLAAMAAAASAAGQPQATVRVCDTCEELLRDG